MDRQRKSQARSRKTEIWIAIIGLLGMVCTAAISNWSDIFPGGNDYRPTGNFETELRYFYNVSGRHKTAHKALTSAYETYKKGLIEQNPNMAQEIENALQRLDNIIDAEDIFEINLPLYQKHFTIGEIQELNRIFSTKSMQEYVSKRQTVSEGAIKEILDLIVKRVAETLSGLGPSD